MGKLWGKDVTAKGRDQGQPDRPEQGVPQEERYPEGGWGPACQMREFIYIYIRAGEHMPKQPSAATGTRVVSIEKLGSGFNRVPNSVSVGSEDP